MIFAAGILILNPEGKALFLKRGDGGDMPGTWCVPGGRIEPGEGRREAAIRETEEEAGVKFAPKQLLRWTRSQAHRETTGAPPTNAEKTGPDLNAPIVGADPNSNVEVLGGEQVDFTTFVVKGDEFTPKLNDENVAYAWAPVDAPPEPLHPGVRVALDRFTMDELDVAQAIADGALVSPQKYANVTLFDIRITGTGRALRTRDRDGEPYTEHVWRDPALYLNDRFLARCNGLPVIWVHPEKSTLDSKEFSERTVGTVFVPYVKGSEVWAVAKIYDDAAIKMMSEEQLSTSPGVMLGAKRTELTLEGGDVLLFEDKPFLLDHIAVVEAGVWDRGGEPAGVATTNGSTTMADTPEKKEDGDRPDAASEMVDQTLKHIADAIAAVDKRMDSMQGRFDAEDREKEDRKDRARKDATRGRFDARKDGEDDDDFKKRFDAAESEAEKELTEGGMPEGDAKKAAKDARKDAEDEDAMDRKRKDAAKKDSEDKVKEKEEEDRKDAVRADSVTVSKKDHDALMARLAALEGAQSRPVDDVYADEMSAIQSRADGVYAMFNERAPRPNQGETSVAYRRRLLKPMVKHSETWKDANLGVVGADKAVFDNVENAIYADAVLAAKNPNNFSDGEIRMVQTTDPHTKHDVRSFYGKHTYLAGMRPPTRAIVALNLPK